MSVANKRTDTATNLGKIFLDNQIDRFNKEYITGSGITLKNNEKKDIVKVIKSLQNRGILLKRTTRKITSQEGGFLNFLRPLMTAGVPLMKSVLTTLTKNGLSTGTSAADAAIQKKIYGPGRPSDLASRTTALIISNEEMNSIKIVRSLEESCLLIKGVSEKIKNETKEQKGGFLSMLLGTLAASMLGSELTGRGVITKERLEQVMVQLEQVKIFNTAPSFN